MKTTEPCRGCTDDFYNGRANVSGTTCWNLAAAKIVKRFRIHRDTMPATPGAYTQVMVPDCYRQPGYSHHEKLPDFVKAKDVIRPRKR